MCSTITTPSAEQSHTVTPASISRVSHLAISLTHSTLTSSVVLSFLVRAAQTAGDPTVRIGNWVEQRALLAVTGQSRGALVVDPTTHKIQPTRTHPRVIGTQHSDNDWKTEYQHNSEHTLQAQQRNNSRQPPSRRQQREAEEWRIAREQQEAEARAKRAEEEKEMHSAMFGHRQPVNRRRALQGVKAGDLDEAALTVHSELLKGGKREEEVERRGERPFHRDTRFSVPIEHSKGGPHHHYGI